MTDIVERLRMPVDPDHPNLWTVDKDRLDAAVEIERLRAVAQALPPSANDRPGESRNGGSTPSGGASTVAQTQREIERLRKALELLADELPEEMHTLDEPDEHWEVIVKMRTIAREALSSEHRG
jgi:hypothetical protein